MNEMHLSGPGFAIKDVPYTLHIDQQIQSPLGASAAGVQFSNEPSGPWTTAQAPGQGGAVQAAPVQYSEQSTSWDYPDVVSIASAWIRVGAWPDQGLQGEPLLASNAIEMKCRFRQEQPGVGSSQP